MSEDRFAPDTDTGADHDTVRRETDTERLDRNWISLVQELRVVQTGVQFLISALLIVPFQETFQEDLHHHLRVLYLITLGAAIGATVFLVAPVAWHRILFRRHRLGEVVAAAHRCAIAGIALLGVALIGAMAMVFDMVAGTAAGVTAGVVTAALFVLAWLVVPWHWRRGSAPEDA
nr:DUF6328 family protein [Nocardia altamirensis]